MSDIMIDSITMFLPLDHNKIKIVLDSLKSVEEKVNWSTGEIYYISTTSNSKLNIKVFPNMIYIYGSLSQYFFNSTKSQNWNDVIFALDKLESELKINLDEAIVSRLDLEGTVKTSHKANSYFEYFGYSAYFNRFIEKNTLYYSNGNRKKRLYNKSLKNNKDLRIKNSSVLNLLRFEISYKTKALKKFSKKINIENLRILELKDPLVQTDLSNLWLDEFNSIEKNYLTDLELNDIKGLGDVKNKLIIDHINTKYGGIDGVLGAIKRNNDVDSKTRHRIRVGLKSLFMQMPERRVSKHIQEIDDLIIQYHKEILLSIKNI